MAECRVLLVGMMGSGKTSVGRELAALTGWPYIDNDALLAQASGQTARQILAEAGEMALRLAEQDALDAALATVVPSVCGVAAGSVLSPRNRRALADGGIVVWLTAEPATLAARAIGGEHRPWLQDDAEEWLAQAAAERAPLFAEVARLIVATDEQTPAEVAAEIVTELVEMSACGPWLAAHLD